MIRFLRRWWGEEPHGLQDEHERALSIDLDLAYVCPICGNIQGQTQQGKCHACGAMGGVRVDLIALSRHMERILDRIEAIKARRAWQRRAWQPRVGNQPPTRKEDDREGKDKNNIAQKKKERNA